MILEVTSRVFWETHLGKKYLLLDFSNLDSKDIFTLSVRSANTVRNEKENSVISLMDISNTEISFNTIMTLKKLSLQSQAHLNKSAIVSNLDETSTLFKLYKKLTNSKARMFKSRQLALVYLFSEE